MTVTSSLRIRQVPLSPLSLLRAFSNLCSYPPPPPPWLTSTLPPTPLAPIIVILIPYIPITFTLLNPSLPNIPLLAMPALMTTMNHPQVLPSLQTNKSLIQNHKLPFLQNFTRKFTHSLTYICICKLTRPLVFSSVLKITI